ncbi:hypothetical protein V8E55_002432, partial [Tylopilus felleus]
MKSFDAICPDKNEKIFQEQYWNVIKGESPRHVRLECMHRPGESCDALITETAHALSIEVVTLMLLAMSVKLAVERTTLNDDAMSIIKSSIAYFPFLW